MECSTEKQRLFKWGLVSCPLDHRQGYFWLKTELCALGFITSTCLLRCCCFFFFFFFFFFFVVVVLLNLGGEDSSIGSVTMAHVQYANMDTMDDDLSTDSDMDSGADEDEADVQDAGPSTSATALATATSMLQSLEKTFPSLSGTLSQVSLV